MASSSVHSPLKDEESRNWAELPSELTFSILNRLGVIDKLENARKVCTPWRRVCKDPLIWRKIDMDVKWGDVDRYDLEIMCRHAVDRSQGGLVEINISHFGTNDLLNYIADRSSNLKSLGLAICREITDKGVVEAVVKLPFLEDLDISYCAFIGSSLREIGQSCPNLKTLKLNRSPALEFYDCEVDNITTAIAECMPELRHLQLFGNGLYNKGLNAILDGCSHLEHLDIRRCINIKLTRVLEKKLSERIRVLRLPYHSTADFPFEITTYSPDLSSDSEDYYNYLCGDSDDDSDYE